MKSIVFFKKKYLITISYKFSYFVIIEKRMDGCDKWKTIFRLGSTFN